MSEIGEPLKNRVYYAARDGMAITLYALLADRSDAEVDELLSRVMEEDGQKCTPLLIASRNGHDKVIRMLLSKFKPNIEQEGTVKFDGYIIEGASPLWCASGAGYLTVVKTLLRYGANVNHPTRTQSTPLRAACFDGRLDIVQYLIENNADLKIANKYNNTCLMIASYKGYSDVVKYLLDKGADPDERAQCGATALHFAAECGHVEIVKILLEHGAKIMKQDQGMTPLMAAAERTKSDVVEYLISRPECSRGERIDALELLGASFANDKDNYSLTNSYIYLERAMKLRFEGIDVLEKPITPVISAYENRVECTDMQELESIRYDAHALHMEALVIRERILGSHNTELPHPVIFRGAVFADSARFDRCISLWLHALKLRLNNYMSVTKDLLRFAQIFSQMIHVGVDIPFDCIKSVLEYAAVELERNNKKLRSAVDEEKDNIQEEMDSNMHTILYILLIITRLLKKCSKEQELGIYRIIYRLNNMKLRTRNGQTILHLTVDAATTVDDFHTNDVCKFPCASTAKLLIQCGADVNALDMNHNTPLHLIVGYQNPISDFLTLHSIIMALIESGAHMDIVNRKGETPFDSATSGVAEIILRTQSKISLKCIAAKAVKKFNLSYQGSVPQSLENFIELHGVPRLGYD
ncbi:hypothetical protein CHUAL_011062 [Chamberlinius hualienensis]